MEEDQGWKRVKVVSEEGTELKIYKGFLVGETEFFLELQGFYDDKIIRIGKRSVLKVKELGGNQNDYQH